MSGITVLSPIGINQGHTTRVVGTNADSRPRSTWLIDERTSSSASVRVRLAEQPRPEPLTAVPRGAGPAPRRGRARRPHRARVRYLSCFSFPSFRIPAANHRPAELTIRSTGDSHGSGGRGASTSSIVKSPSASSGDPWRAAAIRARPQPVRTIGRKRSRITAMISASLGRGPSPMCT